MNDLTLKKELFQLTNIEQTIDAFADLCTVLVSEQENTYICVFLDCRYDYENTVKEFENYLIDLSYKNRKR